MSQPAASSDLDTLRQILFGADIARLQQAIGDDRQATQVRAAELEQRLERTVNQLEGRVGARLEEVSQGVTAQLDELSRRQQAHAERVTQLLDQVMAELTRRTDTLTSETKTGIEELRSRVADLDRRKLSVTDFGSSLAALGQRFAAGGGQGSP